MRTIPRRLSRPVTPGEYRATCAYCGMTWHRSDMVRDATGHLACPQDQAGDDVVTLDRANSMGAAEPSRRPLPGGDW